MSENGESRAEKATRRAGTGSTAVASVLAAICPACVPAYAAFFSAVGLGFLSDAHVMRPLMLVLLTVATGAIAWDTRVHKSPIPLIATIAGGALVYLFRYHWFKPEWITIGTALLVFGATVNYYKRRFAGMKPFRPVK